MPNETKKTPFRDDALVKSTDRGGLDTPRKKISRVTLPNGRVRKIVTSHQYLPSRTKQADAPDADINNIMARVQRGEMVSLNQGHEHRDRRPERL